MSDTGHAKVYGTGDDDVDAQMLPDASTEQSPLLAAAATNHRIRPSSSRRNTVTFEEHFPNREELMSNDTGNGGMGGEANSHLHGCQRVDASLHRQSVGGQYHRAMQLSSIERRVQMVVTLSFIVNLLLLVVKVIASVLSHSLAVVAATVDSFFDILAQAILFYANHDIQKRDPLRYPAGKSKLEPVAVILCASLMGMASLQLVIQSISSLYAGLHEPSGSMSFVQFDTLTLSILSGAVVAKTALWAYCQQMASESATAHALATDHRNDVLSNTIAIGTAYVAHLYHSYWWIDPVGAVCISVYIVYNWTMLAGEQIQHVVGRSAPPEFYDTVINLANSVHESMYADIVRAYHFGQHYLVELEVVMPADMTVRESHDIALALQMAVERLPDVERAFVHVDHATRGIDEHDWRGGQAPSGFSRSYHSTDKSPSHLESSSSSSTQMGGRKDDDADAQDEEKGQLPRFWPSDDSSHKNTAGDISQHSYQSWPASSSGV